jgi:hypothetical protein
VQCLYCEEELKAFRGLFDEDFCCREHRDKYIASFRKSLTRLPADLAEPDPEPGTRLADFREIEIRPAPVPAAHRTPEAKTLVASGAVEIPASKPGACGSLAAEERPAALVEMVHSAARASSAVPLDQPAARPVGPRFEPAYDGSALLPTTEFAESALECRQLQSAPVAASEVAARHAFEFPLFQPSQGAMQLDPEPEPAADPVTIDAGELSAQSTAAGAGPASLSVPAPADCPQPFAACASGAPAGQPAQISVPALASGIGAQPGLAPEMVSGISHEQAANSVAAPHTHGALRPSFWSSVRIKNWKLRITFAKPA